MNTDRLSVPAPRISPPRLLSKRELRAYTAVADTLCASGELPSPSRLLDFPDLLHRALAVRCDSFGAIVALLCDVPDSDSERETWLRRVHAERPGDFAVLSTVAAGAYLMSPRIRAAIGYPGQPSDPPGFEEAVDDLLDLLDAAPTETAERTQPRNRQSGWPEGSSTT